VHWIPAGGRVSDQQRMGRTPMVGQGPAEENHTLWEQKELETEK